VKKSDNQAGGKANEPARLAFKLGTSTILFKEFDPVKILPLLADKCIAIEVARREYPLIEKDAAFREFKKMVDDTGVNVRSIHSPYGMDLRRESIDGVLRCVERAVELKSVTVVLHPGTGPLDNDAVRAECLGRACASLAAIQRRMPGHGGVKIAVENLPRENLGRTLEEMHIMLDDTDRAKIGYCMDVNHFMSNDTLLKSLEELGSRLVALHISDNDGRDEQHWLPGRGIIDWKGWLAALKKTGYSGPMMYEVSEDKIEGDQSPRAVIDLLIKNANTIMLQG